MLECIFIILTVKQLMRLPELLIRFLHLEQVILVSDAVRVTRSTQTCLSYMFSCVFFMALAAKPMFLRTSVLVLAFSRASLWNSMVDNVPSIRFSCSSYRFFLFKAWRATMTKEKKSKHGQLTEITGHNHDSVSIYT